jgi:hypothetical protein
VLLVESLGRLLQNGVNEYISQKEANENCVFLVCTKIKPGIDEPS